MKRGVFSPLTLSLSKGEIPWFDRLTMDGL
jgi:hypothetical protein